LEENDMSSENFFNTDKELAPVKVGAPITAITELTSKSSHMNIYCSTLSVKIVSPYFF